MSFLLCFLDAKHYLLKNEQVQKGEYSTNNSRIIKDKEINKMYDF